MKGHIKLIQCDEKITYILAHWSLNLEQNGQHFVIFQATFPNAFAWNKIFEFFIKKKSSEICPLESSGQ